jgi:hypothetical protein
MLHESPSLMPPDLRLALPLAHEDDGRAAEGERGPALLLRLQQRCAVALVRVGTPLRVAADARPQHEARVERVRGGLGHPQQAAVRGCRLSAYAEERGMAAGRWEARVGERADDGVGEQPEEQQRGTSGLALGEKLHAAGEEETGLHDGEGVTETKRVRPAQCGGLLVLFNVLSCVASYSAAGMIGS